MQCKEKSKQVVVQLTKVILGTGVNRSQSKSPCSGHCERCPNNPRKKP